MIMVGQNVQSQASDLRSQHTYEDTVLILDRLDIHTEGGLKDLADRIDALIGTRQRQVSCSWNLETMWPLPHITGCGRIIDGHMLASRELPLTGTSRTCGTMGSATCPASPSLLARM